jgi:hypothetical protein
LTPPAPATTGSCRYRRVAEVCATAADDDGGKRFLSRVVEVYARRCGVIERYVRDVPIHAHECAVTARARTA